MIIFHFRFNNISVLISVEKVENKLGQHYMKYMNASQQNMIKIVFIALSFMVSAILS